MVDALTDPPLNSTTFGAVPDSDAEAAAASLDRAQQHAQLRRASRESFVTAAETPTLANGGPPPFAAAGADDLRELSSLRPHASARSSRRWAQSSPFSRQVSLPHDKLRRSCTSVLFHSQGEGTVYGSRLTALDMTNQHALESIGSKCAHGKHLIR
jgi:hypothetical protein